MRLGGLIVQPSFQRVLRQYLDFFRGYSGREIYLFVFFTILASNAEAFGIALFLPLFTQNLADNHDLLSRLIVATMHWVGLPITPVAALPVIIVIFVLRGLLQFAAGAYQYVVSAEMTQRIRERMVQGLATVDYRFILGTNAGTLTNVIATEVTRATSAFTYFAKLLPSLINVIVFFAVVTVVSWRLTLVVLLAAVGVFALFRTPSRLTKVYSSHTTDENSALARMVIQLVHAFKYLDATNGFAPLEKAIFASITRLAHAVRRIGLLYSLTSALSQPLVVVLLAGIMFWHARFVGPSLAPVFVLLLYLYRIMAEVFAVQTQWQEVCGFLGGLDAVRATADQIERHRERRGSVAYQGLRAGIELRDVSFAFDAALVLRGVDLQIPRHATVAFVGESGAGKSTLVDLVTGLLKPTSGTVLIDGVSTTELDVADFRAHIGYVPQDSIVFDDSIANNISMWSCDPSRPDCAERIRAAARAAYCDDFIQAMPQRYDSLVGERGIKLSGGQRQRLAIAKELFKQPDLLILDEATSALDSDSERLIQQSIDELKGRMTIILIAHRLSTVRRCDKIFVLGEGRIAESGTFVELYERRDSRFRRMCELQNLI